MTADQRLDQLEPLVSQTLAVADRHTAQLKQIIGIVSQQSDDIQFVLSEIIEVKQDIGELKQDIGEVKQDIGELKQDIGELKQDIGELKQDIGELKQGMVALSEAQKTTNSRLDVVDASISGLDTKLDRILGLLDADK